MKQDEVCDKTAWTDQVALAGTFISPPEEIPTWGGDQAHSDTSYWE